MGDMVPPARITARAEETMVWKEEEGSRRWYFNVIVGAEEASGEEDGTSLV